MGWVCGRARSPTPPEDGMGHDGSSAAPPTGSLDHLPIGLQLSKSCGWASPQTQSQSSPLRCCCSRWGRVGLHRGAFAWPVTLRPLTSDTFMHAGRPVFFALLGRHRPPRPRILPGRTQRRSTPAAAEGRPLLHPSVSCQGAPRKGSLIHTPSACHPFPQAPNISTVTNSNRSSSLSLNPKPQRHGPRQLRPRLLPGLEVVHLPGPAGAGPEAQAGQIAALLAEDAERELGRGRH